MCYFSYKHTFLPFTFQLQRGKYNVTYEEKEFRSSVWKTARKIKLIIPFIV